MPMMTRGGRVGKDNKRRGWGDYIIPKRLEILFDFSPLFVILSILVSRYTGWDYQGPVGTVLIKFVN